MGSLPARWSPSAPAPRTDQHKGGEEDGAGFTLGGGGEPQTGFLRPPPLLKFAPPPRNKKNKYGEREGNTQNRNPGDATAAHCLRPRWAAAARVTTDARPSSGASAPEPPSSGRQGLLPPRASYLRSHVAAGSEQTGRVTTPTEKRRGSGQVCASRFLPAPQEIIWQSRNGLRLGLGPRRSWGRRDPRPGRPSPSHPGTRRPGLGSRPLHLGPRFTAFSCSCEFQ